MRRLGAEEASRTTNVIKELVGKLPGMSRLRPVTCDDAAGSGSGTFKVSDLASEALRFITISGDRRDKEAHP